MNEIAALVLLFAASFVLGSIPWGVIISRVFYHTDVRDHGSGNIGTTNAIRTMGKVGGGAVFVLDFGKGLFSGFLAWLFFTLLVDPAGSTHSLTYQTLAACAFFGCITGHIFSPWLGFKGGKGVAVAVGCMFATFGWQFALIELALFAVVVITTKYVSAGSLTAAAVCPVLAFIRFSGDLPAAILCSAAAVIVIWAHRGNIMRLRAGTESRIGSKGGK